MSANKKQAGFSLMEVNMAVFVMAIGVLSLVVLYPLGLRESTQGQTDLKQSMFADYVLNVASAAASRPEITWKEWSSWVKSHPLPEGREQVSLSESSVPDFISGAKGSYRGLFNEIKDAFPDMDKNKHYRVVCSSVLGYSERIIGIMVQSTEQKKGQFYNNDIYYTEVMFQGDAASNK